MTNEQAKVWSLARERVKAEWRSQGRTIDGLHHNFHKAVVAWLREHRGELNDLNPPSAGRDMVGSLPRASLINPTRR
jgi:hypothetical protein